MISAYEPFCEAYECWTTRQLEDFVKALTRPTSAEQRRAPQGRPPIIAYGVVVDSVNVSVLL